MLDIPSGSGKIFETARLVKCVVFFVKRLNCKTYLFFDKLWPLHLDDQLVLSISLSSVVLIRK
jgi:hypothetical protein